MVMPSRERIQATSGIYYKSNDGEGQKNCYDNNTYLEIISLLYRINLDKDNFSLFVSIFRKKSLGIFSNVCLNDASKLWPSCIRNSIQGEKMVG